MGLTRQQVRERRRQPSAEVQNLILDINEHLRRFDSNYLSGLLQVVEVVNDRRRRHIERESPAAQQPSPTRLRLVSSRK